MRVAASDGRIWDVHRRFKWPRLRVGEDAPGIDPFSVVGIDDMTPTGILAGILLSVVATVVLAVLILVFLPPLLFIAEAVVLFLAVATAIRPWLVVAETGSAYHEWKVRGWLKSRRAIKSIARQLAAGDTPVQTW